MVLQVGIQLGEAWPVREEMGAAGGGRFQEVWNTAVGRLQYVL